MTSVQDTLQFQACPHTVNIGDTVEVFTNLTNDWVCGIVESPKGPDGTHTIEFEVGGELFRKHVKTDSMNLRPSRNRLINSAGMQRPEYLEECDPAYLGGGAGLTVIFLDVDGVLHSMFGKDRELQPNCVRLVRELASRWKAKLVLSSTWRHDGARQYQLNKVNLWLYDITEDFRGHMATRAEEILDWVRRHNVAAWVALDDINLVNGQPYKPDPHDNTRSGLPAVPPCPAMAGHHVHTDRTNRGMTDDNFREANILLERQLTVSEGRARTSQRDDRYYDGYRPVSQARAAAVQSKNNTSVDRYVDTPSPTRRFVDDHSD